MRNFLRAGHLQVVLPSKICVCSIICPKQNLFLVGEVGKTITEIILKTLFRVLVFITMTALTVLLCFTGTINQQVL